MIFTKKKCQKTKRKGASLMTKNDIFEELNKNGEGYLLLPFEDACTLEKILLKQGYAVMITGGEVGDDQVRITWLYAGTIDDLTYPNENQVVFASKDLIDMLEFGDYDEEND